MVKETDMRPPLRKLVGSLLMLVLVIVYALMAMALAEGRVTDTPVWLQPILYAILGLAWVLPAMLLIKWMEKKPNNADRS